MKRKLLFTCGILFFVYALSAQAINNDIFNGGPGDGWATANFTNSSNAIFHGGTGDGWHLESNGKQGSAIFLGGAGDGWSFSNFGLPANNIFNGGQGDGWNSKNLVVQPNSIFLGGEGDGWSQVVYMLGPLPVSLLSFTGEKYEKYNLLKWSTSRETNTSHFELERSPDGTAYSLIKSVRADGKSSSEKNYSSIDDAPLQGNNFYRIKIIDVDGAFSYSNIILIRVTNSQLSWSLFPNPTASLLHVRVGYVLPSKMVLLMVFDNAGKVVSRQSKQGVSSFDIDVSRYAAGTYFLKIIYNDIEETIRFVKSK